MSRSRRKDVFKDGSFGTKIPKSNLNSALHSSNSLTRKRASLNKTFKSFD
jgi:hypothetical protein